MESGAKPRFLRFQANHIRMMRFFAASSMVALIESDRCSCAQLCKLGRKFAKLGPRELHVFPPRLLPKSAPARLPSGAQHFAAI